MANCCGRDSSHPPDLTAPLSLPSLRCVRVSPSPRGRIGRTRPVLKAWAPILALRDAVSHQGARAGPRHPLRTTAARCTTRCRTTIFRSVAACTALRLPAIFLTSVYLLPTRKCLPRGPAPHTREPGLPCTRQPCRPIVMPEFDETRAGHIAVPRFEVVIHGVPAFVPALLVVAARV